MASKIIGTSTCPANTHTREHTFFTAITCPNCNTRRWRSFPPKDHTVYYGWLYVCSYCKHSQARDTPKTNLVEGKLMRQCWACGTHSDSYVNSHNHAAWACCAIFLRDGNWVICGAPWDGSEVYYWRGLRTKGGIEELDVDDIIAEARSHNRAIKRQRDGLFQFCDVCGKGFRGKQGVRIHQGSSTKCRLST